MWQNVQRTTQPLSEWILPVIWLRPCLSEELKVTSQGYNSKKGWVKINPLNEFGKFREIDAEYFSVYYLSIKLISDWKYVEHHM